MEWKQHIDSLVAEAMLELNGNGGRRPKKSLTNWDDLIYWLRRFLNGIPHRMPKSTHTERRRLIARTMRSLNEPQKSLAFQARDRMLDWVAYAKLSTTNVVEHVKANWEAVMMATEIIIAQEELTPERLYTLSRLIAAFEMDTTQRIKAATEDITTDFANKVSGTGPFRRPFEELYQASIVSTRKQMHDTFFGMTKKLRESIKKAEEDYYLMVQEFANLRYSNAFDIIDVDRTWTLACKELYHGTTDAYDVKLRTRH
ncbi:hypothetical protein EC973_004953 [Apophysomyces ossiformis]|uniref:Uncharacterized protein n=1 Tax=Apophysomyces ossiformis TaxID=679940 RepID=A0A8H7EL84_9FUNG|nr:hypothetical protein EC973_004953 [Apophysomyces ossiformis]